MSEKEYIIFCDESDGRGKFYSNFYGGLIAGGSQYQRISEKLNRKKGELNLFGEVKWSKITERYLEKYQELVKCFFEDVRLGHVKIRIMFSQNARQPRSLTVEDRDMGYFKLYYQFIKHAFGLQFVDYERQGTNLRLYFDQFPNTKEKVEQFKGFLLALGQSHQFRDANIVLRKGDIAEVRSHDHVLLQCLDIILGSMCFRLNERHKEKEPGKRHRGKRTKAKEKLYKTILAEIRTIRPHFNIGASTGDDGVWENRWRHPYRHWCFQSKNAIYKGELTKRGQKKMRPTNPT